MADDEARPSRGQSMSDLGVLSASRRPHAPEASPVDSNTEISSPLGKERHDDMQSHIVGQSSEKSVEQSSQQPVEQSADEVFEYPDKKRFAAVFIGASLAAFVTGFDTNCVATIIPVLTDEFNALGDAGWYSTAYLMTSTACTLGFGKLYSYFYFKHVFASVLGTFIVGCVISAAAPSSVAFIFGRALTGLGNAGILSGINIIIARITRLEKRPYWQGMLGGVESIAITVSPMIGGLIVSYSSWRVCFYASVAIAGTALMLILALFQNVQSPPEADLPLREKVEYLGLPDMAVFLPAMICLVLFLSWGGISYSWGSYQTIIPLVFFCVLSVAFVAMQAWRQEKAILPPRLVRYRSLVAAALYGACNSSTLFILAYYLPMWFQTVRGKSALFSGIDTLPMVIGLTISIVSAGPLTGRLGYYTPALGLSTVLASIGIGLTTTFTPDMSMVKICVYQVIYGLGCGLGWQAPYIAAQAVVPASDVTQALVLVSFCFSTGGVVALAVAQQVFSARLVALLRGVFPELSTSDVANSGARTIISQASPQELPRVLGAYNEAIVTVLYIALALGCLSAVPFLLIESRSIQSPTKAPEESVEVEAVREDK